MSSVFNSLGSNYNAQFTKSSLELALMPWTRDKNQPEQQLRAQLESIFSGRSVHLFYKGRQAITFALIFFGVGPGDQVITQAFTCWAVEEGINRSGAQTVFTDTDKNSLNLSVKTIEKALKKAPHAKAILVQHTLGFSANIGAISAFCHKHKLILIEDLAHSFGGVGSDKKSLGTLADATVLSLSRDKVIDAISGGACLIKSNVKANQNNQLPQTKVSSVSNTRDLLYPLTTAIVRSTNSSIFGKLLHAVLRLTPLLTTPIKGSSQGLQNLPSANAQLALQSLKNLDSNLAHRQEIAKIYTDNFKSNPNLQLFHQQSIYLRFPVLVKDRNNLINKLKKHQIRAQDTWYTKPVETGSLSKASSSYIPGTAPNAQHLAQHIVNLPTHIHISTQEATKIANLVNLYTKA